MLLEFDNTGDFNGHENIRIPWVMMDDNARGGPVMKPVLLLDKAHQEHYGEHETSTTTFPGYIPNFGSRLYL